MVKKIFGKDVTKLFSLWDKLNSPGYALTIIKSDEKLIFWNLRLPKRENNTESKESFIIEALNLLITYEKDEKETNSQYVLHQRGLGKEKLYKRLEPSILTQKELTGNGPNKQKTNKKLKQKYKSKTKNHNLIKLEKMAEYNPRYYEEYEQLLRRKDYMRELNRELYFSLRG